MKNKKGDFNFVLLFAIIAGAAILVLSIYGAVRSGNVFRTAGQAELSATINVITDPLQSGSFAAMSSRISFNQGTRILNRCDSYTGFGKNYIAAESESEILKDDANKLIEIPVTNKYIFSEDSIGKDFRVFSKPFELPYRVSDLLFISTLNYCLVSPPEEIAEEIIGLNMPNFRVDLPGNSTCEEDSIRVCFGYGEDCNITVEGRCDNCDSEFDYGIVKKDKETLYYSGSLLYGAIISDADLYECNVKRLLFRTSMVANLYAQKIDLMNMRNCNSFLKPDLETLSRITMNASSEDLDELYAFAKSLEKKENKESCKIW